MVQVNINVKVDKLIPWEKFSILSVNYLTSLISFRLSFLDALLFALLELLSIPKC